MTKKQEISDNYRLHLNAKSLLFVCCRRLYLAGFFAAAAFLTALGFVGFFAAGFLAAAAAAFGFFAAGAFFTFGALTALVVGFFDGVETDDALFFAAAGLAGLALLFGLACRDFVPVLLTFDELADFGAELDRDFVDFDALAVFGLTADVELTDLTAEVELADATFLANFGPGDFDAARFFVADADEPALALDTLFFVFLLFDDDDLVFVPVDSPLVPSLNEPLAPLPFVCLKCFDLTPFFKAILRC